MHPTQKLALDPAEHDPEAVAAALDLPADYFTVWAEDVEAYEQDLIERYVRSYVSKVPPAEPGDQADELVAIDLYGTPADTLRCAATYLEHHGWMPYGRYSDLTVPFPAADITGAVRAAVYGKAMPGDVLDGVLGWHVDMAIAALADHLGLNDPEMHLLGWLAYSAHAITCWNDEIDRTAIEAVTAMRAAADAYDATHHRTGDAACDAEDTDTTGES
ncbi:DUF6197 family protein [Dactylosporangium sp. McL0621]|uniref:DUF6197 family protein n=1 Tax=Dactylosporangium sp. McL0621 TaxID=3415678 RepID=UPI003CEB695C